MPEDGIEVMRSIRAELLRIKVVAFSGFLQGAFLRAASHSCEPQAATFVPLPAYADSVPTFSGSACLRFYWCCPEQR